MSRITIHEKGEILGDAVFAASDGLVTTFAIVAGSAGATLGSDVVLILGFANLFADGFSMAAGNYLGSKSEIEFDASKGQDVSKEARPVKRAFATFLSFNLAGIIPLLPFIFKMDSAYITSTFLIGITLFAVGFLRSIYTKKDFIKSGIETFAVGGFAAFTAFAVGFLIDKLVI